MAVEALTKEELDDFMDQARRIGRNMVVAILDKRGVARFSHLCRADRIAMLAEMRRTQGFKR